MAAHLLPILLGGALKGLQLWQANQSRQRALVRCAGCGGGTMMSFTPSAATGPFVSRVSGLIFEPMPAPRVPDWSSITARSVARDMFSMFNQ